MYPAWKASFDAHIYEGRVLEILLMKTAEEALAEVTVGVSVLAERCKKANGRAEFWVGHESSPSPLWTSMWAFCLPVLFFCSGGSPSFRESDDGSAVFPGGCGYRWQELDWNFWPFLHFHGKTSNFNMFQWDFMCWANTVLCIVTLKELLWYLQIKCTATKCN